MAVLYIGNNYETLEDHPIEPLQNFHYILYMHVLHGPLTAISSGLKGELWTAPKP